MPKLKAIVLISSLSILLSVGLAKAEETTTPLASKIGYVNAQRILNETKAGKAFKQKMSDLEKEKTGKLEAMKDEILKMDEELAKKQLVLSTETKSKLEEDIRRKQLEFKRYQEDAKMVLDRVGKESLIKINNTAMKIIKKIGEEEKYTLILEVRENFLYGDPSADITDKVIAAYDKDEELEAK